MVAAACLLATAPGVPDTASAHVDSNLAVDAALAEADDFLDRYLQPSGRIARTDQGGDTVSESMAYGMLMAFALDDETRFRAMWEWTDGHLQRDDGLLAWRWADGGIADYQSAADADLMVAAVLAMAADRFADRERHAQRRREPELLGDATDVAALWPAQRRSVGRRRRRVSGVARRADRRGTAPASGLGIGRSGRRGDGEHQSGR
jgi:hypothetical protein